MKNQGSAVYLEGDKKKTVDLLQGDAHVDAPRDTSSDEN